MKNTIKTITAALGFLALASGSANAAIITIGDGLSVSAVSDFNEGGAGFQPEKSINGLGLSGGVHANTVGTSWLTPIADPTNQFIEYDLGDSYNLDSIQIWNVNNNGNTSFGARSVDIYFSNVATPGDPEILGVGNGDNWIHYTGGAIELTRAPDSNNIGFELASLPGASALPGTAVRFVRLETNTNWSGVNNYTGIAEIQFNGTPLAPVPEPSSTALLGLGGLALILRRRK